MENIEIGRVALSANTEVEIIFGSVAVIFGSFVCGVIIANLTSLIQQANFEGSLTKKVKARSSAL